MLTVLSYSRDKNLFLAGEMGAEGVDEGQLARCKGKGKKLEQQLQGHTMEEHCRRASVLLAANDAAGAQPHIR